MMPCGKRTKPKKRFGQEEHFSFSSLEAIVTSKQEATSSSWRTSSKKLGWRPSLFTTTRSKCTAQAGLVARVDTFQWFQ